MKKTNTVTVSGCDSSAYFCAYVLAILDTYLSKIPGDHISLSEVVELLKANENIGHNFKDRNFQGLRFMISDQLQQRMFPGFALKKGVGVVRGNPGEDTYNRAYTHSNKFDKKVEKLIWNWA